KFIQEFKILVSQTYKTLEDQWQGYFFARLQSNVQNWLPQQEPQDWIRDMQIALEIGEGSAMKNHTLYWEEKTKTEGRFVTEKYSMVEEEGDATIKRVEGGDATKQQFFPKLDLCNINKNSWLNLDRIMIGTSMTLEFWDSRLLGSESGIHKPLS
ncbi:hypothetical protein V8G54_014750, partial [Vigna mungo]